MGAGLEVARSRLALAELAGAGNDCAGAAKHLREAYRRFSTMRAKRYVERVEALAAALRVGLDELAASPLGGRGG
jgi:hypothetical protein